MKILRFVLLSCFIFIGKSLEQSIQCLCYKWFDMIKADCTNKNLYNTFIKISFNTHVLDLSYNLITILHGNEFQDANLRQLKEIKLSNNLLYEIHKLAFNGLEYLEKLDLSYNYLKYIHPDIFGLNPRLKALNLSYNSFNLNTKEISFLVAPSIQVLDMVHCNLKFINEKFFLYLENLQVLNISDNYISEIAPETLKMLKNLQYLDISMNNLTCTEQATALVQYLINQEIHFTPFCQSKEQKLKMSTYQTKNSDPKGWQKNFGVICNNTLTPVIQKNITVTDKMVKFLDSIPTIYLIVLAIKLGFFVGVFSACICIKKKAKKSSADNDLDNFTCDSLIKTPPGTPPSPYHSRIAF